MSADLKRSRRWLQFSLGTTFAAIAVVAAALAMWREDTMLAGVALLLLVAAFVEGPIGRAPSPRSS